MTKSIKELIGTNEKGKEIIGGYKWKEGKHYFLDQSILN